MSFHGIAATYNQSDTEMNEANVARTRFCLTAAAFLFEGTVSLLLSFVFSAPSGNFSDFSRAGPDLSQWERAELSFARTRRAELQGLGSWFLLAQRRKAVVRVCVFEQDGLKTSINIHRSLTLLSYLRVQQNAVRCISIWC